MNNQVNYIVNGNFNQSQANELSKYEIGAPGLWKQKQIKFTEHHYVIDNIQICPNRQSVHKILPALNNSVVCYVKNAYSYNQFIAHISCEGKIIKYINDGTIYDVQMAAADLVLIALYTRGKSSKKMIVQWNLNNCEQVAIQTSFNYNYSYPYSIFKLFSLSNQFCISSFSENKLKICYFRLPITSNQNEPSSISETIYNGNTKQLRCLKLNQQSMIGWVDQKPFSQQWLFVIIQCALEEKTYRFPIKTNSFQIPAYISDIWQIHPGYFYVEICFQKNNTKSYESYIWEYRMNNCRKTSLIIHQDHQLQFLGQFRQQLFRSSVIYYVDLFTQQILAIDRTDGQHYSPYSMSYYYPQYAPGVQYCFIDGRERWIHRKKVCVKKIEFQGALSLRLTFLIEEFGSFDQDLVEETVRLVMEGKQ